jgi:hypothetical protein
MLGSLLTGPQQLLQGLKEELLENTLLKSEELMLEDV